MFDSVTLALSVGILIGGLAGYLLCLAVNSGKVEVVDKPVWHEDNKTRDIVLRNKVK